MALRSLHIDAGRAWRGGQRQVFLLATALRSRGHEPLIFGVARSPLLQRAQDAGIATASAKMRADWDLRSAKRIRAVVRAWRPDVVHAHDARSHAIALIALAGEPTPLVVTRRVTFPLKSVRVKYGSHVNRFIAISHAVKRAMVKSGVSESRIDVVHSGVPTPTAAAPRDWRRELGWPRDSVIAGVVGAMTAEKGIDTLRHIAERLGNEAVQRTRIIFLGGTDRGPTMVGPLRAHRAGFVTEIYDAMAGLDVLWHPARDEGLGTSLIDSLALKVPPIAFAVGGVPEIVRDGLDGILVPPEDASAFATAHTRLLDAAYRAELGRSGPAQAANFSVSKMTEGVEQVYQRVLIP